MRALLTGVALLLAVALITVVGGLRATASPVRDAKHTTFHCPAPVRHAHGGAIPVRVCIPSLRVAADVLRLGLNPDHTVQVPSLSHVRDAGWYKYSSGAGLPGPSVVLGHVDSGHYGPGVFFRLGTLHHGATVMIDRADGRVATYRIDRVVEVSKKHFPTHAVYGQTTKPTLRLITCGGKFDYAARSYVDNIIAFATLSSLTRA